MSMTAFGLMVLASFVLPVPVIAWLDRPKKRRS